MHAAYASLLKPVFFRFNPEDVHDRMIGVGAALGRNRVTRALTKSIFHYSHPALEQTVLGIPFKNPVGLAAGFDKNAELTGILPDVGFGFEEVGSITGEPCEGNPKPRLWRLKRSKGLVVYYGLKNDGAEAISTRLRQMEFRNIIGTSVAMTNCAANLDTEMAIRDYAKAFRAFANIGHYFTINISCPNTQGGQPFVEAEKLERLLAVLDQIGTAKPVFIKLSPDMTVVQVDALLDVAKRHRVHGIITTNLTKKRDNPHIKDVSVPSVGGISGKPVQDLSDEMLRHIHAREGKRFVLIGCGGIFNAKDAYRKIRMGASLVQLATGMIFEGPQLISEISRGLVELIQRDGFTHLSQAVGADVGQVYNSDGVRRTGGI
jgi:dihydroorotate dehydrogenase